MRGVLLVLVVVIYFVDVLFTLFELDTVAWKFHLLYLGHWYPNGEYWNGWKSNNQIVYDVMAFVSRAIIFTVAGLAVKYGIKLQIFVVCFFIELSDIIDYWIFNNAWWNFIPKFDFMMLKDVEFEYNYVKLAIIVCFAVWEWRKGP